MQMEPKVSLTVLSFRFSALIMDAAGDREWRVGSPLPPAQSTMELLFISEEVRFSSGNLQA
jgi:hypothetical protein